MVKIKISALKFGRRKVLFAVEIIRGKNEKLRPLTCLFQRSGLEDVLKRDIASVLSILHFLTVAVFSFLLLIVVHCLFSLPSEINNTEISFPWRTMAAAAGSR